MLSNALTELDRAHLIHPVSSYRSHEGAGVRVLKSAKGATLVDVSGGQLLDGFAVCGVSMPATVRTASLKWPRPALRSAARSFFSR